MNSEQLYFAYGSNMLEERINLACLSARFFGVGKLAQHRLTFGKDPDGHLDAVLGGCGASVISDATSDVFGVLWKLTPEDLVKLDQQENLLTRVDLTIESDAGDVIASVFVMSADMVAGDGLPSEGYMKIVRIGAERHCLPVHYQQYLARLPTSGMRPMDPRLILLLEDLIT